ncbi:MAG: sensor domain-containing diguanylate cyclase, partial [Planctomycetia bacterium]|nr:sensor domain-containing diguanylate cyclase [Planctomycetia bacterium]
MPVAAAPPADQLDCLQATLAGLLDPLTLMVPVRDAAGHVVDFTYAVTNPAACDWIGTDRDRLRGRRLLETFPEVGSTGLMRPFADTAETGRPAIIDDFPFPRHGVGTRWMDIRAVRVEGWVCFVWRDVTERHVTVERLARSEELFRLLAENSTDVVVRIGADDRILWVSPSVTPVLGWKAADWVGRTGTEFLATEESLGQFVRDRARVAAGQGVVSRTRIRTAAGFAWVEIHTSPYRTSEGRIDGMVASLRVVDAEVRMAEALERRARTDDLTGLLNRKEALDQLAALVARHADGVAVLWCDIDRFKGVNDSLGHAAGDAVLATLGERIRECLRTPADVGGRIGGDEVLVILDEVRDLDDAVAVAERLRRRAAEPIPFDAGTITATLSIGVALALRDEGLDALLARADDAMYRAK